MPTFRCSPASENEDARSEIIAELGLNTDLFESAFDRVIRMTQMATKLPICLFSIVEGDRQFFKAKEGLDARETPRSMAFCAWAITQENMNDIFLVEDADKHPDFQDNPLVTGPPHVKFYAGIPVLAPNKLPVGTVCLIDTTPGKLTAEIETALRDAKGLLEDSLMLQIRAAKDHLTGLYNRRYFDEGLNREWRRAYRQLLPISLLLCDIDNFKAYNDRYGHPAGDEVLTKVADRLSVVAHRAGDLVARYGGEEFVIVLPETDEAGCKQMCERLLEAVRDLQIPNLDSPFGKVTMSIGAAVAQEREQLSLGEITMLSEADAALYLAKDAGRDRFAINVMDHVETDSVVLQRSTDSA